MKKISIVYIICLLTSFIAEAQLLPSAGQFYAIHSYYNPAVAGSSESLRATMMYRRQWSSLSGAPQTTFLTGDSKLGRGMGAGLALAYDEVFKYQQTDILGNFSYRIELGSEKFLQAGVRAGVSMVNYGVDALSKWDAGDPLLDDQMVRGVLPRFGTGVFFKHPKFWLGLSAPDIITIDSKKLFVDDSTGVKTLHSNFIFTGGAKFNLNEYINIVPSAMVRYYPTRQLYYLANVGLEFNQTVTAGLSYSSPNTVGVFGIVGLSPKLKFGYRYELIRSGFQIGSFSTNELMLSYGF